MQLSRNYTTSDDIKRVETDIAWYKKTIGRYQEIARKDKDGIAELVQLLTDSQLQSQFLLNTSLEKPSFSRFMKSAVYAAEVRVYGFVLELLNNPKKLIEDNQRKLEAMEKYLGELKKLSKRD